MTDKTAVDEADRELKQKHRAMWASGDYPALASELAQGTAVRWSGEILMREQVSGAHPQATPLEWHDRHLSLLKAAGIDAASAVRIARDTHLDKLANDYGSLAAYDITNPLNPTEIALYSRTYAFQVGALRDNCLYTPHLDGLDIVKVP